MRAKFASCGRATHGTKRVRASAARTHRSVCVSQIHPYGVDTQAEHQEESNGNTHNVGQVRCSEYTYERTLVALFATAACLCPHLSFSIPTIVFVSFATARALRSVDGAALAMFVCCGARF